MRSETAMLLGGLAVGVCGAGGLCRADVAEARIVSVNQLGVWTIGRLGYTTGTVRLSRTPAQRPAGLAGTRTFLYELPQGARQGPHRWYTLELHVAAKLRADSGSGDIFIDGQTDRWDAVQLEVQVRRTKTGLVSRWQTYDLIDGTRHGQEAGRTLVLDERNYVVNSGVRSGTNRFSVVVEEFGSARLASLDVLPDSALGVTSVGVPTVKLTVDAARQAVEPGGTFTIEYQIAPTGAAVKQVLVRPAIDPNVVDVVGKPVRRYPRLDRTVTGTLTFRALRVARTKVAIDVLSNADNQPRVEVAVRIDPTRDGGLSPVWTAVIAGGVAFGAAFVVVRRRRR